MPIEASSQGSTESSMQHGVVVEHCRRQNTHTYIAHIYIHTLVYLYTDRNNSPPKALGHQRRKSPPKALGHPLGARTRAAHGFHYSSGTNKYQNIRQNSQWTPNKLITHTRSRPNADAHDMKNHSNLVIIRGQLQSSEGSHPKPWMVKKQS
jgi:hypothetical protein